MARRLLTTVPFAASLAIFACTVVGQENEPDGARWRPVCVVMPAGELTPDARTAAVEALRSLTTRDWIVVAPPHADRCGEMLHELRQRWRIAHGGVHVVARGDAVAGACSLALAHPHEVQTLVLIEGEPPADAPWARLRRRRVIVAEELPTDAAKALVASMQKAGVDAHHHIVEPPAPDFVPERLVAAHEARELGGAAGEVALALDDFHDAAAKGDEDRYFARLPDDAVFLGTDATERWTGAEFRAFAMPYFQRGPAWTYVPVSRHVEVAPDGAFAWFDEVLDNEAYGECRGTGVLQRRDGK